MSDPALPDVDENPASRPMDGGWQTTVHRVATGITRSASPWSVAVMSLLRHLEAEGFEGSPRPVGSGFDEAGNELLSFVSGASPQPAPWSDAAIVRLGGMLARLHDVGRSFQPELGAVWKQYAGRGLGDVTAGFGHGDLGPWNIMAVDGLPTGFIDWDTSGPTDPIYELAQVAWLNVQLHDDDVAELVGLTDVDHRAAQLELLLDAYGLPVGRRAGFVDTMVEVAVTDAAAQAVEHEVSPTTTTGCAVDGYPFAWGMAWRIRSAAWMLRHRVVLERAIGVA